MFARNRELSGAIRERQGNNTWRIQIEVVVSAVGQAGLASRVTTIARLRGLA